MNIPSIRAAVAGAVLLLVATGCGSAVDGSATPATVASDTPGTTEPAEPASTRATTEPADPSAGIKDIEIRKYAVGQHVMAPRRVAYDQSPPFGGAHDQVWATCTGVVYDRAVRNENMVHSLEHGAVWIAYNPEQVDQAGVAALAARVKDHPYMLMSPYPGLDRPVSLQSWGHRLKLDDPRDQRIDDFIGALRRNPNMFPEPGAPCESSTFDQDDPPPFDPGPPPADAEPVGS